MKKKSIEILEQCIELQVAKSQDYQSSASDVRQADYYRLGVDSIYDMMHTKMLRLRSLMEVARNSTDNPKFESMADTAKDLINYASFFAAYLEGGIDGQSPDRDMFNRTKHTAVVISKDTTITLTKEEQEQLDIINRGHGYKYDVNTRIRYSE